MDSTCDCSESSEFGWYVFQISKQAKTINGSQKGEYLLQMASLKLQSV